MTVQTGIYICRCSPTNKVYVGSSKNIRKRVFGHVKELSEGVHDNTYLQHAWDKHGKSQFVWILVEECAAARLLKREQWWVDFLRATDRRYGYNRCNPGDSVSPNGTHLSLIQIEQWKLPAVRDSRLVGLRKAHKDKEWLGRRATSLTERWRVPAWRKKMLKILKSNSEVMQERSRTEPGFKENRMRGIIPKKINQPSNEIV